MNASTLATRFMAKVSPEPNTGCWLWTGAAKQGGYGQIGLGGKRGKIALASRTSWELHNGPIPAGLCVCHRCDNPPCVNPAHLFLGTNRDNSRDMAAKGRHRIPAGLKGTANRAARMTDDVVRAIRARYAPRHRVNGQHALAREFGVSQRQVWNVLHGQTWGHVE